MCSSWCTAEVICTWLPLAWVRSCYNLANIAFHPDTAGVILQRRPRKRRHFCNDHICVDDGMALRASHNFAALAEGKWSSFESMLRYQPRIVSRVDQAVSPFHNFLREIGSLWFTSAGPLGRKTWSIVRKRFLNICVRSLAPPWMGEMKSSR